MAQNNFNSELLTCHHSTSRKDRRWSSRRTGCTHRGLESIILGDSDWGKCWGYREKMKIIIIQAKKTSPRAQKTKRFIKSLWHCLNWDWLTVKLGPRLIKHLRKSWPTIKLGPVVNRLQVLLGHFTLHLLCLEPGLDTERTNISDCSGSANSRA